MQVYADRLEKAQKIIENLIKHHKDLTSINEDPEGCKGKLTLLLNNLENQNEEDENINYKAIEIANILHRFNSKTHTCIRNIFETWIKYNTFSYDREPEDDIFLSDLTFCDDVNDKDLSKGINFIDTLLTHSKRLLQDIDQEFINENTKPGKKSIYELDVEIKIYTKNMENFAMLRDRIADQVQTIRNQFSIANKIVRSDVLDVAPVMSSVPSLGSRIIEHATQLSLNTSEMVKLFQVTKNNKVPYNEKPINTSIDTHQGNNAINNNNQEQENLNNEIINKDNSEQKNVIKSPEKDPDNKTEEEMYSFIEQNSKDSNDLQPIKPVSNGNYKYFTIENVLEAAKFNTIITQRTMYLDNKKSVRIIKWQLDELDILKAVKKYWLANTNFLLTPFSIYATLVDKEYDLKSTSQRDPLKVEDDTKLIWPYGETPLNYYIKLESYLNKTFKKPLHINDLTSIWYKSKSIQYNKYIKKFNISGDYDIVKFNLINQAGLLSILLSMTKLYTFNRHINQSDDEYSNLNEVAKSGNLLDYILASLYLHNEYTKIITDKSRKNLGLYVSLDLNIEKIFSLNYDFNKIINDMRINYNLSNNSGSYINISKLLNDIPNILNRNTIAALCNKYFYNTNGYNYEVSRTELEVCKLNYKKTQTKNFKKREFTDSNYVKKENTDYRNNKENNSKPNNDNANVSSKNINNTNTENKVNFNNLANIITEGIVNNNNPDTNKPKRNTFRKNSNRSTKPNNNGNKKSNKINKVNGNKVTLLSNDLKMKDIRYDIKMQNMNENSYRFDINTINQNYELVKLKASCDSASQVSLLHEEAIKKYNIKLHSRIINNKQELTSYNGEKILEVNYILLQNNEGKFTKVDVLILKDFPFDILLSKIDFINVVGETNAKLIWMNIFNEIVNINNNINDKYKNFLKEELVDIPIVRKSSTTLSSEEMHIPADLKDRLCKVIKEKYTDKHDREMFMNLIDKLKNIQSKGVNYIDKNLWSENKILNRMLTAIENKSDDTGISWEDLCKSQPSLVDDLNNIKDKKGIVMTAENIPMRTNIKKLNIVDKPIIYTAAMKTEIKKVLEEWITKGFIQVTKQEYCGIVSNIIAVKKPGKDIRLCFDARTINKYTCDSPNVSQDINHILMELQKYKYYSLIDLKNAFMQIKLNEEVGHYFTFAFDGLVYKFNVLPFGSKLSSIIFSQEIREILKEFHDFVYFYIDDITIVGNTVEECKLNTIKVLSKLLQVGLEINIKKCKFVVSSAKVLGRVISYQQIKPDYNSMIDILKIRITNWHQLKKFQGCLNYLSNFIPNIGIYLEQLNFAILQYEIKHNIVPDKSNKKANLKKRKIPDTPEINNIIDKIKFQLFNINPLSQTFLDDEIAIIYHDASNEGYGGVIFRGKIENDKIYLVKAHPVAYISGKFKNRTKSSYEIELLAICRILYKARNILRTSQIIAFTDNKGLSFGNYSNETVYKYRQQFNMLREFNVTFLYIPGISNKIADFLSRVDWSTPKDTINIDFKDLIFKEEDYKKLLEENKNRNLIDTNYKLNDVVKENKLVSNDIMKINSYKITVQKERTNNRLKINLTKAKNDSQIKEILTKEADKLGITINYDLAPTDTKERIIEMIYNLHHNIMSKIDVINLINEHFNYLHNDKRTFTNLVINDHFDAIFNNSDRKITKTNVSKVIDSIYEVCHICNLRKAKQATPPYMSQFTTEVWKKLQIDITYLFNHPILVVTCTNSNYTVALRLENREMKTIIDKLLMIFSMQGYPDEILCDNEFNAQEIKNIMALYQINLIFRQPYVSKQTAKVEVRNKQIKDKIEILLKQMSKLDKIDFDQLLYAAVHAVNNAPTRELGISPFKLRYFSDGLNNRLQEQIGYPIDYVKFLRHFYNILNIRNNIEKYDFYKQRSHYYTWGQLVYYEGVPRNIKQTDFDHAILHATDKYDEIRVPISKLYVPKAKLKKNKN